MVNPVAQETKNKRYVKVHLSFGDKLKLLFFGLVAEDKLPEVVRLVDNRRSEIRESEKPERPPLIEMTDEINNKEEKLDIPFFDLGDEDVKSNF
jgi:hypothetical protein